MLQVTYKIARRIAVAVIGTTVLLLGVIMLITPGPAFVVIPTGLAILGLEFAWARQWLNKVRETISRKAGEHRAKSVDARREERVD